jgi:hypothetical protein
LVSLQVIGFSNAERVEIQLEYFFSAFLRNPPSYSIPEKRCFVLDEFYCPPVDFRFENENADYCSPNNVNFLKILDPVETHEVCEVTPVFVPQSNDSKDCSFDVSGYFIDPGSTSKHSHAVSPVQAHCHYFLYPDGTVQLKLPVILDDNEVPLFDVSGNDVLESILCLPRSADFYSHESLCDNDVSFTSLCPVDDSSMLHQTTQCNLLSVSGFSHHHEKPDAFLMHCADFSHLI